MCGQAQDLPLQWFFGITLPNLKRHLERRSFPYRASIDISLLPDESGVRAESRQVPIYRNAPRWNRDRRNGTGFKTGAKAHVAPLGLGRGTHRPAINMSPLWGLGAMGDNLVVSVPNLSFSLFSFVRFRAHFQVLLLLWHGLPRHVSCHLWRHKPAHETDRQGGC